MSTIKIKHLTSYRYRTAVSLGPHQLMLRPRETRDFTLNFFDIQTTPDAHIDWSYDVSGNAIATAQFSSMSESLMILSHAEMKVVAPLWPIFPIAASAASYPFAYSANDLTDLGSLVATQYEDKKNRLKDWVEGFVMRQPTDTLGLLKDISDGVTARISYQSRETQDTQGPLETLDRGWGSCRDFAVLFAEAVRTLGFGARIVSGYLLNTTGNYTGSSNAGSTHAWVEVFITGAGWIAFDPTNKLVGAANLIPVAVARRIEQVAPVSGSFQGSKDDMLSMDVTVDVEIL